MPRRSGAVFASLAILTASVVAIDAGTQLDEPVAPVEPALSVAFTEGPAWDVRSGDLFFSDITGNRIVRLTEDGRASVFRQPSNYANGLAFDSIGRLIAVEYGDPVVGTPARLTRTDLASGRVEVLLDHVDSLPLRGPNDLLVDGQNRIWFTDTRRANLLRQWAPGETPRESPASVYRIDSDSAVTRVIGEPDVSDPNGLMLSPDARTLYVTDAKSRILAFPLDENGELSGGSRVFADFSPGRGGDGMAIDEKGNLYVAAGLNHPRPGARSRPGGVYVFAPDGHELRFIPIPMDSVSNVAFGGHDRRTLYITAGGMVFKGINPIPGLLR